MTDELRAELRVDEADPDELVTLLGAQYGHGSLDDAKGIVYMGRQGGRDNAILQLRYDRRQRLADIDPGPAFDETDGEELRNLVADVLMQPGDAEVSRMVLFSPVRVVGAWRFRDRFQIVPMPDGAPVVETVLGKHPFMVEYRYQASSHHLVSLVRRRRIEWELTLLLNLIARLGVRRIGESFQHHWVLTHSQPGRAEFLQEGYSAEGHLPGAPEFSTAAAESIELEDDGVYYGLGAIGVEDVFTFPRSVDEIVLAYQRLSQADRARLQRASFWLMHASGTWHESKTAYYLAVINSIESLIEPERGTPCTTCGRVAGKGPTRLFTELLDRYAPAWNESLRARADLYRLRSRLAHGTALLCSDFPGAWGALMPREWEQLEQARLARQLAQVACLNWMLEHGEGPPVRGT